MSDQVVHPCSHISNDLVHRRKLALLELIRSKRERHWRPLPDEAKLGFRGWHQRGYLPHFDAPDVTQFITFHLRDSFPITRRAEWEPIRTEPEASIRRRKLEAWLDRGHGECWLRRPEVAESVEQSLLASDGHDYRMVAWSIMPNHIHAVVEVWRQPLARLIARWKGASSRRANLLLLRQGQFWDPDYYDTLIRDEAHLKRAIRYTEENAAKARLVQVPRDWPWCSARRRDVYESLVL